MNYHLDGIDYDEPTVDEAKEAGRKPWCPCRSGEYREEVYDARGIFVSFVCRKCRKRKLAGFRPEIFKNPGYHADEPIEPEDY